MRDGIELIITDENGKSLWIFSASILQFLTEYGIIMYRDLTNVEERRLYDKNSSCR